MAFGRKKQATPTKKKRSSRRSRVRKGFDIATWIVPTLSFMIFSYAMVFVVFYTMRVGGPNVSLYLSDDIQVTSTPSKPKANVEQMMQGISDAFDPNKK